MESLKKSIFGTSAKWHSKRYKPLTPTKDNNEIAYPQTKIVLAGKLQQYCGVKKRITLQKGSLGELA